MKKPIFLSLIFLSFYTQSYSQAIDIKSDTAIYQSLMKTLRVDEPGITDTIRIFYKTSLHLFKILDFKHKPLNTKWTPIDKQLGKDALEGLQSFINQIDINSLSEYELPVKLGRHPFKMEYKDYKDMIAHQVPFLTFSPVIYSADKKIALCSVDQFLGFDVGSEAIYLLMFRNGKWEVVRALGSGFS